MPIHPLPVISEEEEQKAIDRLTPPDSIVVRYGYNRQIGEFAYSGDQIVGCGTKFIARTERGTELAEMLTTTCTNSGCGSSITRKQMLQYIEESGGKQYPFSDSGKILRIATIEDLNEWSRIETGKPRYIQECRKLIRELDLDMKLVEVEPLFGGERLIFYFASEQRVDFRELVRRLAAEFQTRIEMRQVGARDEARLVADYEKCGQHCCCKQFLKVLKPISMRNAKIQKATLDPAKISGRCGRLMCCLRYEEKSYDYLRKQLPRRNARILTPDDGPGTVINTQVLTQLVLVELDKDRTRVAIPVEQLEKLPDDYVAPESKSTDRDSSEDSDPAPRERRPRPRPGRPLRDEQVRSAEDAPADQVEDAAQPSDTASADNNEQGGSAEGQNRSGRSGKKRRRRRRGRSRGGSGGSPSGGQQGGSGD